MSLSSALRRPLARRGWPIADLGPFMIVYLTVGNLAALILGGVAVWQTGLDGNLWSLGYLLLLAIAFEEGATRAARLKVRLRADLDADLVSVWAVAGAIALTQGQAVLLVAAVRAFTWVRQRRPAGRPLYREWFTASSMVLGALAASAVAHAQVDALNALPWALAGTVTVLLVIITQTAVNRGIVTIALIGVGVRGRRLVGGWDENLTELATLCLGALVGLAVLYNPWLAALVVLPMISLQRGALVRELERLATIDAKTGLLNAVTWEEVARRELARAKRDGLPVAVLIIDIDRFKAVNDRWGHLVGDAVLRGVGRCLDSHVREYDTVARFGGEEFVAVLPAADDRIAMDVAERLRAHVNTLRVSDLARIDPLPDDLLAVSIGVSILTIDGDELPELLLAADGALYAAKAAGRNRVVLADRGTGPARSAVSPG